MFDDASRAQRPFDGEPDSGGNRLAVAVLPSLRMDSEWLPKLVRFPLVRQRASRMVEVSLRKQPGEYFRIRAQAWTLGDMVVGAVETWCGLRLVRSAKRVRADGAEQCVVVLLHSGGVTGEADGVAVTATPGSVLIVDRARPNSFDVARSRCTVLIVRRDCLSPEGDLPHGLVVPGVLGTLLADYIGSLERSLAGLTAAEAQHIEQSISEVIRACIAPSREGVKRANARLQQSWRSEVKRIVDAGLHDPDLSPAAIAMVLGISRSALYRLFDAESGGVSAFIRRRRLRFACRLMTNPRERRRVSEIAFDCGFKSESHFSRAFRDEFGVTPSTLRAAGPTNATLPANDTAALEIIHDWLARLD